MRRVLLSLCTVIGAACLVWANSSTAHAFSCSFQHADATADGANQLISETGCLEQTPGGTETGTQGATVNGFLNLGNGGQLGNVAGQVQASGNANLDLGGTIGFSTLVSLPPFLVVGSVGSNLIRIGNVTYDVSALNYSISGMAKVMVNASNTAAVGDSVQLNLTATPMDSNNVVIGSEAVFNTFCGNAFAFSSCSGIPNHWTETGSLTNLGSVLLASTFHMDTVMTAELQLNTIGPNSNNASIDASDPFNITSMELFDANGVPIPGVTFVAEDGTVFPDAADMTTPIPATLPLFAAGIGGLGLLGWRKKREAKTVS